MRPAAPELEQIYLLPGELVITSEAQRIVTVLGSCITVAMFHPQFRTAAMCHAMLPKPPLYQLKPEQLEANRFKYVSQVIPTMAEHFARLGGAPSQVKVKIFGGANVLTSNKSAARITATAGDPSVGDANLELARRLLDSASLSIDAFDVGGTRGRKIIFHTGTGQVLHRYLP